MEIKVSFLKLQSVVAVTLNPCCGSGSRPGHSKTQRPYLAAGAMTRELGFFWGIEPKFQGPSPGALAQLLSLLE